MGEQNNDKFKALTSVLEDYTEWFSELALYVGYVGKQNVPADFTLPVSFSKWVEKNAVDNEVSTTIAQPIIDTHNEMKVVALDIIEKLKGNQQPSHKEFITFKNLYGSFVSSIRRLEKDNALNLDGTNDITGLRPAEAIQHDLDREMERLSRNGNPFALIVLCIDKIEAYKNPQDIILRTANSIKSCMRPFDDAYYLDGGQFLLSLKHADTVGAESAVRRIQYTLNADVENTEKITVSCCLSEPVSGDEISVLLKNMKNDLEEHESDGGVFLKLLDISPLERFIGSKQ